MSHYVSSYGVSQDRAYQAETSTVRKGYKYGRQHSWECTCQDCIISMTRHYNQNQAPCFCHACKETRKRLDLIAETEERGRQARIINEQRNMPVAGINICDRPECGSMGKSNVMGNATVYLGGHEGETVQGQLCPACVGELVAWWESPVGKRDRAYTKPWERAKIVSTDMTSAQLMQLAIEKGREELNGE